MLVLPFENVKPLLREMTVIAMISAMRTPQNGTELKYTPI